MKIIYAIQCLAFEDLGSFAQTLGQLNYQIKYLQLGVDSVNEALNSKYPVILLGGPIGVYETKNYPYLSDLINNLEQRLKKNYPTLGICLGAQLIAIALGARVYQGHIKEIGWSRLILTDQGFASPLKYLENIHVLHWHGDTFDLPDSVKHLAGSIYYPNQAFSVGLNILALQFHVEVDPLHFERWLIGHSAELQYVQVDILNLRQENLLYGSALQNQANLLLRDWIANVTPVSH
ncbi:glutamine amidotransferase [Acinetobacter qingfengensis]|uniref:Glutamine amidotransferase n=1 Tax=Acinetobacter qingfengensis TaxID=1262585 RepID=A0A1E7R3V4_9GAMM|nr:glutamine amidotransferase [Acinetobacter qingfengensis]KAA8731497.1 glutamine amidotransferase [Acinetobacter qingfengensis]OEY93963.1 glutamine amidotransferase [Acinetobacter qingfengensis]